MAASLLLINLMNFKNQSRKGLIYLKSRVHIFPHCADLRKVLAKFMLENFSEERHYQMPTSQIALSAIDLMHRSNIKKYIQFSVLYL